MVMFCRGVRGATTTDSDASDDILTATRQLLALMIRVNEIQPDDVASAIFSATEDLNAEFPAMAARQLGWLDVPLICTHEINVPGSLTRCIRILLHWNTDKTQQQVSHVYIKEAVKLRPDLSKLPPVDFAELESWIAQQMAQFSSKD
jgi:chorismate mutase